MPGLESDLINLVTGLPAFTAPILAFWDPAKVITDPLVVARFGYNRLPQSTKKPETITGSPPPFLTWRGPFRFDQGQTSPFGIGAGAIRSSSGTKKATFWFFLYSQTETDSMSWASAIKDAINQTVFPYNLSVYRLTAALFVDMFPITLDQTQINGKEYPTQCASIGYDFGFQVK